MYLNERDLGYLLVEFEILELMSGLEAVRALQNFPPQSDPGLNDWSLDAGLKLNGVEEWSQIWSLGLEPSAECGR